MKIRLKWMGGLIVLSLAVVLFNSCDHNEGPAVGSSSALYDTLGWFIQGGEGKVAGQGAKMITDPDHNGKKIQAGRLAIRVVVEKALGVIAADPKLAPYFPTLLDEVKAGNTSGLSRLLNTFTDFVQQAVSGQKVYKGLDMVKAHDHSSNPRFSSAEGPLVDSADFDRFVMDVAQAAESLNVPNSIIGQLGDLLYTTEKAVVQDLSPTIATTALYDTLGWFIQGAEGPVAGQGIAMIADPDNEGEKIQAGRLAIRVVVEEALGIIAADDRLAKYFPTLLNEVGNNNTTGLAMLLHTFTDFVQQAVSGQKVYKGLDMVKAHNPTDNPRFGSETTNAVSSTDFDIFVSDIAKAAQNKDVPGSIIAQLGTLLNSTKGAVVQ